MLWALNGRTFLRSIPQIWVNRRSDLYQVKCMRSESIFGGGTLITAVSYRPLLHFRRLLWFAHMHERSIIGSFYINSLNNCAALSCVLLYCTVSVLEPIIRKPMNKKKWDLGEVSIRETTALFFFFFIWEASSLCPVHIKRYRNCWPPQVCWGPLGYSTALLEKYSIGRLQKKLNVLLNIHSIMPSTKRCIPTRDVHKRKMCLVSYLFIRWIICFVMSERSISYIEFSEDKENTLNGAKKKKKKSQSDQVQLGRITCRIVAHPRTLFKPYIPP